MGHYHDEEIRAHALSMFRLGRGQTRIREELTVTFGDHAPSERTLARWIADWHQTAPEQLADDEVRLAIRADRLIDMGFDQLEEDPKSIPRHLMSLNAIAGTMRDKQFRRTQPQFNILSLVSQYQSAALPTITDVTHLLEGELVTPKSEIEEAQVAPGIKDCAEVGSSECLQPAQNKGDEPPNP